MFCFLPTIRRIPPQSNEVPSSTGPWFFSCTKNGSKNGPVWITEVQYLLKLFLGSLNLSLTFFVSVGPCLNTWYTVEILKVENKFRLNKKMNTLFLPTANIYEPRFDNPPIYIYQSISYISTLDWFFTSMTHGFVFTVDLPEPSAGCGLEKLDRCGSVLSHTKNDRLPG